MIVYRLDSEFIWRGHIGLFDNRSRLSFISVFPFQASDRYSGYSIRYRRLKRFHNFCKECKNRTFNCNGPADFMAGCRRSFVDIDPSSDHDHSRAPHIAAVVQVIPERKITIIAIYLQKIQKLFTFFRKRDILSKVKHMLSR